MQGEAVLECLQSDALQPVRKGDGLHGGAIVECVVSDARHRGRDVDGGQGEAVLECLQFDALQPVWEGDGRQGGALFECPVSDARQPVREGDGGQGGAHVECVVSNARNAFGQLDGLEGVVEGSSINKVCRVVARIGGALEVDVGQRANVFSDGFPVFFVDGAARHGDGGQVGVAAYQGGEVAGLEVAYCQHSAARDEDASDGGVALLVVQHHEDFARGVRVGGGDGDGEVIVDDGFPSVGDGYQVEVFRGRVVDAGDGAFDGKFAAGGQFKALLVERQADFHVAGHGEGAAFGQIEGHAVVVNVDVFKEAVAFRARIARVTFLAVLAADARPRLSAVHAQVDGVGCDGVVLRVGGDALGGELRARGQLGQRGIVAVGAGFALLALRAVGADGVAVGVGQELAVQRPVPVAVVGLRGAYLRGVALVALVALRAVVDGDGGCVQEADGEAHLHAVLYDGRHGGDVVRRAEQRLEGLDVGVGFGLPGFEGGDACGLCGQFLGVLIDLLPEGGVIVLAGRQGQRGKQEEGQSFSCFHIHLILDGFSSYSSGEVDAPWCVPTAKRAALLANVTNYLIYSNGKLSFL